ncbi:tRNA dihydrouridine(20/20a) synthase DusA [secondary endosymbiont of Ctenarytaina eucalypti]|uniref:tRNA-dihydrouridine(20/20a) synthase n=1 Tax=secondary endosymbiont of Ctenarytaina eucalypti TaxID=1199245 RepID=J3TG09_9ENTR|nr:tRNA dihydrouridine(20/20a) synthase DusA [secondary endosymbiont of Ctenarytaina eucalypti]AFP85277.1 tRNA dihydrouridine synthase A [secondary endosymbiont of Ctenarytaina eucalypti]
MLESPDHQNAHRPTMESNRLASLAPGRFSVAPMLDRTDRHCRFFLRQLSRRALLYTEMVTTNALFHGKGDYLAYNDAEHPLALQLGGSNPDVLARAAKTAQERGYDEINLNVGCPSSRVQHNCLGACLMAEKDRVAACVSAMNEAVSLPITVKTRLGIDEQDSYSFLCEFIDTVSTSGGCQTFIIHARKAWLKGLLPKENRKIPPLNYGRVYQLKRDFPSLRLMINGGITTLKQARAHLQHLDGVMIGRAAYNNPSILLRLDSELFGTPDPLPNQASAIDAMLPYIEKELYRGTVLSRITRHMHGLFQGLPGARQWRRYLRENAHYPSADTNVLIKALSYVQHN